MSSRENLIFTEILKSTGLGHFSRCTALYAELRKKNKTVTLVVHHDGTGQDLLSQYPSITSNWLIPENLMPILKQYSPPISIIDSYLADSETYHEIQSLSDTLVCFDDDLRIAYPKGSVIINAAAGADKLLYERDQWELLIGSQYALLREPFRSKKLTKKFSENVQRILITTGAEDRHNLMELLIEETTAVYSAAKVTAILGPAFKRAAALKSVATANVEFVESPDAETLWMTMADADLAITSGGQTMYELAKMQVPMVVFAAAENQSANINGFLASGAILAVGSPTDPEFRSNLRDALEYARNPILRKKRASNASLEIDGLGAERIVDFLNKRRKKLTWREATNEDCELYFKWANDPGVREMSYQKAPIPFDVHKNWFATKIGNPRCLLLIFLNEFDNPVGQVRIEVTDKADEAVINLSISDQFRGFGYSSTIIRMASEIFFQRFKVDVIYAFVFESNKTSLRGFQAAGYDILRKQIVKEIPSFVLERRR